MTADEPLLPDPRDRPMVGLALAAKALDIGVTKAYELVAAGEFPVTVRRVGGVWKVSTLELHRFIGSELADVS